MIKFFFTFLVLICTYSRRWHRRNHDLGPSDNFQHNHDNYESVQDSNDDNKPNFKHMHKEEVNALLNTPICE